MPERWEYASVPIIIHSVKEILDNWGSDGWELVTIVDIEGTGPLGIMKRPKPD